MNTFGKRNYDHMQLDPWAKKRASGTEAKSRGTAGRSIVYMLGFVALGAIAFAGVDLLLLA